MERELERFVALAARTGRRVFRGPLTYGAAHEDQVDWSLFDLVSVNYYGYHARRPGYLKELRPYQKWGKPVVVQEFGSCTFKGAPKEGGMAWYAVDYDKDPPEVRADVVRSERVQAEHIALMYDVFSELGFYAATVYDFVSPDSPHDPETPKYDYDAASYSVVKTLQDGDTWHWEPKQAFHTLARRWRRSGSAK